MKQTIAATIVTVLACLGLAQVAHAQADPRPCPPENQACNVTTTTTRTSPTFPWSTTTTTEPAATSADAAEAVEATPRFTG